MLNKLIARTPVSAPLALVCVLVACRKGESTTDHQVPTADTSTTNAPVHALPIQVEELTNTSGILSALQFGHFGHGRSCSVADLDNDGLPDLILGHPKDETFVLHNVSTPGHVLFEPGPTLINGAWSWTIQAADYDNDGDMDLYFGCGGIETRAANHLMRNNFIPDGTRTFTEMTDTAHVSGPLNAEGVPQVGPTSGAMWLDLDLDGDEDLYLSEDVVPLKSFDDLKPTDWEGYDVVLINNGDGTFTDESRALGFDTQLPTRHSVWLDIENDGDLDIYENNFSQRGHLWRNLLKDTGTLMFEDVTDAMSLGVDGDVGMPLESFVSGTEDFNNDGYMDLIKFVRGYPSGGPYLLGHTILENVNGTGFVDVTGPSNLNDPFEAGLRSHNTLGVMGALPGDFDGDGLVDVYIGNGGPEAGKSPNLFLAEEMITADIPGVGPMTLPHYGNYTDLIDYPAPEDQAVLDMGIEYPPYPYRGHGPCAADFDLDGTVEVFMSFGGTYNWGGDVSQEPDRMFRFTYPDPQGWLEVRPIGDGVHVARDALGTRAAVTVMDADGNERTVYQALRGGNGFSSDNTWAMYFGLGQADHVVSLEVDWLDGTKDIRDDVQMNQLVLVSR